MFGKKRKAEEVQVQVRDYANPYDDGMYYPYPAMIQLPPIIQPVVVVPFANMAQPTLQTPRDYDEDDDFDDFDDDDF